MTVTPFAPQTYAPDLETQVPAAGGAVHPAHPESAVVGGGDLGEALLQDGVRHGLVGGGVGRPLGERGRRREESEREDRAGEHASHGGRHVEGPCGGPVGWWSPGARGKRRGGIQSRDRPVDRSRVSRIPGIGRESAARTAPWVIEAVAGPPDLTPEPDLPCEALPEEAPMSVYLNVVYVNQLNYGGGMTDPTGCWYCSAEMIGKTFESGPRFGVPEIHGANGHAATGSDQATAMRRQAYARKALSHRGGPMKAFRNTDDDHQMLAKRENLRPVEDHPGDWTLLQLEQLLRASGPIFFYWWKTPKGGGPNYGHASVLVGTDDATGRILFHDPEDGRDQTMRLQVFNELKQDFKWGMMRRNGVTGGALVGAAPGAADAAVDLGALFG